MDIIEAAERLSALGNTTRISLYRLLIRAGEEGLNMSDIKGRLELPASTLSHHVGALVQAGLIIREKRGRETVCTANYTAMHETVGYLTDKCCVGFTA
jgi:DNA-binding transcriptional ArsR family regulator